MISEDILNFFVFQLLHCFLETCLICSPTLKIQEVRYNFMRFDSSRAACACFLIISVLYLMRHLNIASLLFKYFHLTVEAYMDIYVTLLFGRGIHRSSIMEVDCTKEEGSVRPKLDRFGWGRGVRFFNYRCHKWMTPIIASIKYFLCLSL